MHISWEEYALNYCCSLSLVVKRSCCGPYLAFCYFDCTFENVSKTSACLQIFHVQIYFPWNLLICMLKFIFNGTMITTKLQPVWPRGQDILPDTFGLWARTAQGRAARINSDKAEVHTSLGGLLASEANFSCFGLLAVAEKRIRKYSHAYWTGKEIQRSSCDTHLSIRWAQILPAQDLEQDPCSVLRACYSRVRTPSALQYTAALSCLVVRVNFLK